MNYSEYEEWIKLAAASAAEDSRLSFACETVRALNIEARGAIQNELTARERQLIASIVDGLEGNPDLMRENLEELETLLYEDQDRKVRYIPSLTEFLCSIAHFLDYRDSSNPAYIAAIGLNIINVIDYAVSGQVDGYSIADILVSEDMRAEIERQERLLMVD
ncbi:MAG: hypothetical protein SGJ27_16635 [Candidatus Melainabacteria bacterium]|nr:hypothetical protein [Candidatus Melainabacteria bacterium]